MLKAASRYSSARRNLKLCPNENWLPINRGDIELSLMYRIYAPDAEKMKTWKTPKPKMLQAAK